jgi:hypothetical protein
VWLKWVGERLRNIGRGVYFREAIDTMWRIMGLATQRAGAYSHS